MTYEEFEKYMAEKYPRYFGEDKHYGGFAIGELDVVDVTDDRRCDTPCDARNHVVPGKTWHVRGRVLIGAA